MDPEAAQQIQRIENILDVLEDYLINHRELSNCSGIPERDLSAIEFNIISSIFDPNTQSFEQVCDNTNECIKEYSHR